MGLPAPSQINRCARLLRKGLGTNEDRAQAATVVNAYRSAHQLPMTKANNGLRSFARTVGCEAQVTQRLKEMPSILAKLQRSPGAITRLEDIGGCRAVLRNMEDLRRLEQRLLQMRPQRTYHDYVIDTPASGYRAVHVVVEYRDADGIDRPVEIQLRTGLMNLWADGVVERIDRAFGTDLKHSNGPPGAVVVLAEMSDFLATLEGRGQGPPGTEDELKRIIDRLLGYVVDVN